MSDLSQRLALLMQSVDLHDDDSVTVLDALDALEALEAETQRLRQKLRNMHLAWNDVVQALNERDDALDGAFKENENLRSELANLDSYCSGIREAALEVGGVDHTVDAPTMIRLLAVQRDHAQAALSRMKTR